MRELGVFRDTYTDLVVEDEDKRHSCVKIFKTQLSIVKIQNHTDSTIMGSGRNLER